MPPLTADTNLLSVRAIRETVFGTTPSTPALQVLRIHSSDMRPDKETEVDPTLRSDGMIDSLVRQAIGGKATLPFSLAYGADFELFLIGAMRNLIVSKKSTGTFTIDKTGAPAGKAWINRAAGDFLASFNLDDQGAFCRLWGFEPAANNDAFKVDTITTTRITVDDPNNLLTNDAAGEGNEQVDIRYVRNGITRYGYSIEEDITLTDASHAFCVGKGLAVAGFNLVIENSKIIRAEWRLDGMDVGAMTASAIAGETLVATPITKPMSASGEIRNVRLSGVDTSVLSRLELGLENGVRRKKAVGSLTPIDVGIGRFNPSGRIRQYFESIAQFNAFRAHNAARLDLIGKDLEATPNIIVLTMPQFRYGEGGNTKEGIDSDIFFDASFQAERDPTLGTGGAMLQWSLLPNAPLP